MPSSGVFSQMLHSVMLCLRAGMPSGPAADPVDSKSITSRMPSCFRIDGNIPQYIFFLACGISLYNR